MMPLDGRPVLFTLYVYDTPVSSSPLLLPTRYYAPPNTYIIV